MATLLTFFGWERCRFQDRHRWEPEKQGVDSSPNAYFIHDVTTTRMTAKPRIGRKERFMAALAFARMTQTDWAEAHEVTQGHLSQVLSGRRESVSLVEKIDAFIAKQLGAHIGRGDG